MPRSDSPNFHFNPTYFKSSFCGTGGMEGRGTTEGMQQGHRTRRHMSRKKNIHSGRSCGRHEEQGVMWI